MTSGIELYINGIRADIEEDALILMNYSSEDLQDPTIVKNSYSQSVTLPGTPQNEKIFGMFFKPIRQSTGFLSGSGFSPIKKEPFIIFAKTGEVLEQGYMKLDEVLYNGKMHSYKVTLFGGMGDFLYNLMYRDNGEKKTLADLAYLDGTDNELDFTINIETIINAWLTLQGANMPMYKIINFAPCNNGLPEDFSANKTFTRHPADLALPTSAENADGVTITPSDGVLATFEQDFSEWEMCELRSYLQRPVISAKAIIDAICDTDNNGGYTVNLDEAFFNSSNPYYTKVWMTLPMLTEVEVSATSQEDGSISEDLSSIVAQSQTNVYDIWSSSEDPGRLQGVFELGFNGTASLPDELCLCYSPSDNMNKYQSLFSFIFVGYDSSNSAIISTPIYVLESERVSSMPSYIPLNDHDIHNLEYVDFSSLISGVTRMKGDFVYNSTTGRHEWNKPITIGVTGWSNVVRVEMVMVTNLRTSYIERRLLGNYAVERNFRTFAMSGNYAMDRVVERVTTGTQFTKANLLANTMTPADFLLSFIKTFNLKLFCDNKSKVIDIVTDENYLSGEYIDLEGRVDEQSKSVIPIVGDVSRLLLNGNMVESKTAEQYRKKYGKNFGDFTIFTGYEFNDEEKPLMDSVLFRSAICANSRSDFFKFETKKYKIGNNPAVVSVSLPAAALSPCMVKYVNSGNVEAEIESPTREVVSSVDFLPDYPTYDYLPLVEFCDAERKGVGGAGVLLFHSGTAYTANRYRLTDDDARALVLNDGIPCWQTEERVSAQGVMNQIPLFKRHIGGQSVNLLLDYGIPREFYDISIRGYADDAAIYYKYWQRFIAEQYDAETRQLKVKVDFEGIQVGQQILRRPVFYDGCWWYISNISNHALAKGELTEVTLVKLVNFQYNEFTEE